MHALNHHNADVVDKKLTALKERLETMNNNHFIFKIFGRSKDKYEIKAVEPYGKASSFAQDPKNTAASFMNEQTRLLDIGLKEDVKIDSDHEKEMV